MENISQCKQLRYCATPHLVLANRNTKMRASTNKFLPSWRVENPLFSWDKLREEKKTMSAEEQRRILVQRFGVESEVEETPELVAELLHNLRVEIDGISEKEAYEAALFIVPDHVEDESFLLAFLRACEYNVKHSAQRIVSYWDRKVQLFGVDVAFKPYVSLLDFKEEDHLALVKGGLRLLPHRDQAGRAIMYSVMGNYGDDVDGMVRYFWYILHAAFFQGSDCATVQKKGVVYIGGGNTGDRIHAFDSVKSYERYVRTACSDASSVLPTRVASLHIFARSKLTSRLHERLLVCFGRDLRMRLNFYAVVEELKMKNLGLLASCGIPAQTIPTEIGGEYTLGGPEWISESIANELLAAGAGEGWEDQYPLAKKLLNLVSMHNY